MDIQLFRGDITTLSVDAIVNAANPSLLGGGGVDGAIHAAAGPALLAACRQVRASRYPDGIPSGVAVATKAGNLKAKWVIHTAAPNLALIKPNPKILADCFKNSLYVAARHEVHSIAFPALGAGAFRWDPQQVAQIAYTAINEWVETNKHISPIRRIVLVAYNDEVQEAFEQAFALNAVEELAA
ncbi:O-acetyl-ADP-ribose deacetylase [Glutamicibacter protophormiae]|jgi:O-acetyl-ADP-ribose deacetylase (regulator of RNase III)|uniref:O-acetyl-ADP-ribose deacetylase (Regulator of RNase III) n=1 Tax=Glutamicibacter protophormiae TaxID=37930 RepID=A0ABS4XRG8_GLUPR|nr:O-acetyl-ADP-ribose deacetylase [Glutamicibacter protophormiae]MBP2399109.1 O-acetyl-ADP-ribose deacetylase (regulator of RNase III) [Glutamicibacter protophormiae]QRQ79741.1 O-acetyl-ADP-ribose deacetylase [Glutamicibacter protophormiae]WPR65866.1 O-acetyl-ADP-ribose deacetylase [Glutamicibacter protophormiae]WPR69364.1 O-acetyl-ADP-ribose deacetylase [Glutamicibacter protophormiae]GGL96374.1 O-acetyl-ADP-ribose deacetylase [Glutamicibacter protophormiae]